MFKRVCFLVGFLSCSFCSFNAYAANEAIFENAAWRLKDPVNEYTPLPSEVMSQFDPAGEEFSVYTRLVPGKDGWTEGGILSWTNGAWKSMFNLSVLNINKMNYLSAASDLQKGGTTILNMPVWKIPDADSYDVVIRRKKKYQEMYINGTLVCYRGIGGPLVRQVFWFPEASDPAAAVGGDLGGVLPFQGAINELAVWNRYLSDAELKELFGREPDREAKKRLAHRNGYLDGNAVFPPGTKENSFEWANEQCQRLLKEFREHDPQFPRYHAVHPGDTYDPRAVCFKGKYHLFPSYLYGWWITLRSGWPLPYWGHLSSPDLVHWKLEPLPDVPVFDANGCVKVDGDKVVGLGGWYSPPGSGEPWSLSLFTSTDSDLRDWTSAEKLEVEQPPGARVRDCDVWKQGDEWFMIATVPFGLTYKDANKIHLYKSPDLREWTYAGPLYEYGVGQKGTECPYMLRVEDKLVMTALRPLRGKKEYYLVGNMDGDRFVPEAGGSWDYGLNESAHEFSCYITEDDGRTVVMHPMRGKSSGTRKLGIKERFRAGWNTIHTLPREVFIRENSTLGVRPIPELKKLRGREYQFDPQSISNQKVPLAKEFDGCLEVELELIPGAGQSGILFDDGEGAFEVRYDSQKKELTLDMTHARGAGQVIRAPLTLAADERLQLHVFVDRSIIEVFFNGGKAMTWRWFPTNPDRLEAFCFSRDGQTELESIKGWKLKGTWLD